MGDRITEFFPGPRAVRFGGRVWPVPPATLADLIALQTWVDAAAGADWDSVWETADDPGRAPGERDRALYDALDADERPPSYDDPGGWALLATADGVRFLAGMALRRGTPGVTDEEVDAAVVAMTAAEFFAVRRAFHATPDAAEAVRRLTDHLPRADAPAGKVLGWGELVDGLCERYGIPPRDALAMSLPEVRNALRRGRAPEPPFPAVPHGRAEEAERLRVERLDRAYGDPSPIGDKGGGQ